MSGGGGPNLDQPIIQDPIGTITGGGGGGGGGGGVDIGGIDINKAVEDAIKNLFGGDPLARIQQNLTPNFGQINQGLAGVGGKVTDLGTNVTNQFGNLTGQLENITGDITSGFQDLTGDVQGEAAKLGKKVDDLGVNLNQQFNTGFTSLTDQLTGGISGLQGQTAEVGKKVQDLGTNLNQQFNTGINTLTGNIEGLGGDLENLLKTNLEGTVASIGSGLGDLGKELGNIFGGITGSLGNLTQGLGLGNLFGSVSDILQTNLSGLQGSLGGLQDVFSSNLQGLQGSLGGALSGLQGELSGGLGALQGNLGNVLGQIGQLGGDLSGLLQSNLQGLQSEFGNLGTNIQSQIRGLQSALDASSLGDINQFLTGGGLESQLKDFLEKNTLDFRSLETFDQSDTGKALKAAAGLGLAGNLLGEGAGGLGALLGGAGLAGLLGVGGTGIPGLSDSDVAGLKDFLLGSGPSVEQFTKDTITGGQRDLFERIAGITPGGMLGANFQVPNQINLQQLQDTLSTSNFANLPTAQTQLPQFQGQFDRANLQGQGLGNIPQQASNIQTDFLSSLFPQGQQQQTALSNATSVYNQGLGQTPLNTFRSLQDVGAQTQQLDDFFTTNIQNPMLERFQEDILPGISRRFAGGNQFFGSERQRADDVARENLLDTLTQERSRLGFEQFGQARDRALQAAGAQAGAQTAAQQAQSQEALGRGGLALQDLLGRGGLILEQGLGTQGQRLQADQFGQQGAIAQGNQFLQALQANQQAEQLGRQSLLERAGLSQAQDRFNLESAIQRATGTQQAQTSLADLLFRGQQANQASQQGTNQLLGQILGIPQLENAFVSLPGQEGLLQGLLAGGSQALGAALPALLAASDERLKDNLVFADEQIEELLDNLTAYEYDYTEPEAHGEGKRVSVMAQDLEKSKLGKRMIQESSNGDKLVAYSIPMILAAQANLNKRLRKLGV